MLKAPVMAQLNKKKVIGLLLCPGAVRVVVGGWAWARWGGETSTDNANVRGDVTSLAPKVAGYVMAVEADDNQTGRQIGQTMTHAFDRLV
jgi:membrane fusion protein (multidrug efflux system)